MRINKAIWQYRGFFNFLWLYANAFILRSYLNLTLLHFKVDRLAWVITIIWQRILNYANPSPMSAFCFGELEFQLPFGGSVSSFFMADSDSIVVACAGGPCREFTGVIKTNPLTINDFKSCG